MQETLWNRFIDLVSDPLFWVVTVFFGAIVGIIGNYGTRISDRTLSLFSARRKRAREKYEREIEEEVQKLMNHPQERFDAKLDMIWFLLRAIIGFLCLSMALNILIMIIITTEISKLRDTPYNFINDWVFGVYGIICILLTSTIFSYASREVQKLRVIRTYYKTLEEKQNQRNNT